MTGSTRRYWGASSVETEAPWPEAIQRPPECPGAPSQGGAGSGAGLADEKARQWLRTGGGPGCWEVGPHFWNSCIEFF